MTNHKDPPPGSEDDLRAENEVLKLKLEMDYGMKSYGSVLSPLAENQWLKSVSEFEDLLSKSKGISIYELIGRPQVKPWHALKPEKVSFELKRILGLLEKNGITIQNLEGLDDMAFYRAITEELLPKKFGEFKDGPFMPPIITWLGKQKD